MSEHLNQKLQFSRSTHFELQNVARQTTRELIRLNRMIDPKFGFEQTLVAREIVDGRYVNGDSFAYDVLPDCLYHRLSRRALNALMNDGRIRIDTFALDPQINGADLPDNPESPYILATHKYDGLPGLPIVLGRRALVLRASLDPYVYMRRYSACLQIDDPDGFVSCITEKLTQVLGTIGGQVVRVLHAPCTYQWSRLVGTESRCDSLATSAADPEDAKYFIKPRYGFHDAEFRFVWILDQDFEGHVDIQCPDLPEFCSVFKEPAA